MAPVRAQPAGGGFDIYARAVARHIGKYIPGNPTVIPRNMPGGGSLIAARAKDKGIAAVVFDRGGFQYHGRIKALADAARESGLKF